MAYTKSPTMDTYSSESIDLTREITSRAGNVTNKDEDYINVFLEQTKSKEASDNRSFIMKRAGTSLLFSTIGGTIRGSHYWEDQQSAMFCIGTTVYIRNLSTGVVASAVAFVSTTGDVGFAEYLYEDGTAAVIVSDGTKLVQIAVDHTVTPCVDADLPAPHDPNIVFLDGYIFLVKLNTGDIYGSDLNNPLSWDPSNFINAEIEADYLKRLIKVNNYLVGFGTETIEYFWDAGIATGSPLQRNDTPVKRISYLCGLAQEQNASYFIGRDFYGDVQVFKISDFKIEPISNPTISRYLNSLGTDYTQWRGNVISYMGHKFYVITAGTVTYCCDLTVDNLWTKLAFQANDTFPIYKSFVIGGTTASSCIFSFNDGTGNWYKFDETLYRDINTNFSCVVVTESNDFGTMNRKNMHRLVIQGDRPPGDASVLVQWTDDDYQSYSTGIYTNLNQDLPSVRQLGSFRQRSFKLTFSANTLMRIQGMVVDINKGSS